MVDKTERKKIEKKSNKKIAFGAIMSYVYLAIQIISGILFIPLISKHYGQDQYGLITLSNTFVNLLMTDIGISAIACRFLAQARAEGNDNQVRSLTALLYKIYFIMSAFVFAILFIMYFFIGNIFVGLTPDEVVTFKEIYAIMGICSVFVFAMQGFNGVLNAYEEYATVRIINIVQRLLYILFVALALSLDWSIISIALITGLTNFICSFSKYFFIRFKLKLKSDFKNKVPKEFIKNISIYSIWQIFLSIFARLNNYLSSPILGIVSDANNIAIYGVSLQLETYAFYISNVLGGLFVPKIARIYAEEDEIKRRESIYNLGLKIALIMSSISLLLIVGFISCGQEFLTVWMDDPAYDPSYLCTIILMLAQVLYLPNIIFKSSLQFIKDKIKFLVLSSALSLVVFLATSFVLGYYYGAIGMCISVAVSTLVKLVVELILYGKFLNVNVLKYLKSCYLKQIPIILLGLTIGLLLHYFVRLDDLYKLLIIIPSIAIPYLLYIWFVLYDKNLRKSLLGIFKRS